MFAVISLGGKQYRVTKGERLVVDRLAVDAGGTLAPDVVLASDGAKTLATADELKPVKVSVRVKEHTLGPKIAIRTYRAKKSSSRRMGFRARQSVIEVESIALGGTAKPAGKAPTEKAAPAAKTAAAKTAAAKPAAKPAAAKKPAAPKKPAAAKPAAKKPAEKKTGD
ncbi:MAG: 50S ribosomal protein L21 [Actinomycetota bacterium]